MKEFFRQNRLVLVLYLLFLIPGGIVVLIIPKAEIHLFINQFHNTFFDFFFKNLTWLGSGWMVMVLFLILLIRHKRESLIFLSGNLVITLFIQGLKHLVFPEMLRPVAYFKDLHSLYLIPGEAMHFYNSFPSGHSATAFGIFIILIYLVKKPWVKPASLILAMLIAFSRVYLSQHFFMDILAGSFIGTFGMGFTIYLFNRYYPGFISQNDQN